MGSMIGKTGGSGMASIGKDEDGWIKGRITGIGLMGSGGAVTGTDGGASGIVVTDPPPPKGVGLGMNTNDLLLIVLLRFLRSV